MNKTNMIDRKPGVLRTLTGIFSGRTGPSEEPHMSTTGKRPTRRGRGIGRLLLGGILAAVLPLHGAQAAVIGGVDLGSLTDYHIFIADGRGDANLQGATKGYVGDIAIDGIQADERTSGGVPFAGTMYTNDSTLDAWQDIVDQNTGQASAVYNDTARISGLEADLTAALAQISSLPDGYG